jgi:Tfp pilus assembly protein PilN
MIKINLLDSITDRPTGVAMVEERVASRATQTVLLALTVAGLLVLGAGYDYVSAHSEHDKKQRELENEQRINRQMLAVTKEQEELQAKTKDVQVRIDAIQKLKASQQGPGAVLHEIKQRFDNVPGLYLTSIEQKGNAITIKGESPDEKSVTRFGQSLEFSGGMFSDLNIETSREVAKSQAVQGKEAPAPVDDPTVTQPEVVTFIVKCVYSLGKSAQPAPPSTNTNASTNQVAKN